MWHSRHEDTSRHFQSGKECIILRGVNFHLHVLNNADHIMSLIPSFVEDKQITELKQIQDSIKLGQFMMLCQNVI